MRNVIRINDGWLFTLDGKTETVNLPHTWNAFDGQDGTNGYLRTKATYSKELPKSDKKTFLECKGVNSKAEIRVNNELVAVHEGGYSAFRVDISDYIRHGCRVDITADNSPDESVYPTMADFTFYGGVYRDVNLIEVPDCRFSMKDYGSDGIYITPRHVGEGGWELSIKALIDNADCSHKARFTLIDAEGNEKASTVADLRPIISAKLPVEDPILWNGRKNPYLYTVRCEIFDSSIGEVTDNIDIRTGLRDYRIDSHKGFFLNGEHIKLQGVSRHQDRENMGNAITEKQHAEDVKLILDVGANSVRLAHYQQNSYFYDLCDESGLLVWAEVPVISRFSSKRNKNAEQQLVELIKQNYNHPSIFCWGIENEITIGGSASKRLITFLKRMNKLARYLDPTRYTTCAQLCMCPVTSPLNHITDILGYNHYFGWYMGSCNEFDKWLDEWHRENPEGKLCLSEYGAEGITKYHSDSPLQGDYSEDYQALFHEHYIKAINERDWLWGSYVWNMFDFGSASRNEGGVRGRNNKGLVTFDRKIKKDSFWLYKAYWSDKKFVRIAGERYVNRPAGKSKIKVYSNCPEVTLEVNGKAYTQKADKVFIFEDVELKLGENVIKARGGKGYYMRGTFTHHNVDFTKDLFHMADDLGFSELSMEPVVAPPDSPEALTEEDLPKLFDQYELLANDMLRRQKAGKPITFYHYILDLKHGPCIYKRISGCGSGTEYMAVTPWGDLYPCHQFVGDPNYKLGNVWDGVTNTALRDEFKLGNVYARPDCKDCWARLYCAGGCAANALHATGDIHGTYEYGCKVFRKRMECALMMQVAQRLDPELAKNAVQFESDCDGCGESNDGACEK